MVDSVLNLFSDPLVEKATDRKPLKMIQKKKKKQIRKPTSSESDHTPTKESKVAITEEITPRNSPVSSIQIEKTSTNEWMTVDKHLKSVRSRLKVNEAVKSCPQLIEHKENYTPLCQPKTCVLLDELKRKESNDVSSRTRTYSLE